MNRFLDVFEQVFTKIIFLPFVLMDKIGEAEREEREARRVELLMKLAELRARRLAALEFPNEAEFERLGREIERVKSDRDFGWTAR